MTVGPGIDQPDRGIARQLLCQRLGQYVQRWLVIVGPSKPCSSGRRSVLRGRPVYRERRPYSGDGTTAELHGRTAETGKCCQPMMMTSSMVMRLRVGGWRGLGWAWREIACLVGC